MFRKCLMQFVQAQGVLHKIASGQNRGTPIPFCMHCLFAQTKYGDKSCMANCFAWCRPPQVLRECHSNSVSRFKEGRKINHSGCAFVPICHGAAITIPFSTLFVFKTKASGCDRESDFLCRLFMQLNHYDSSNSK